jgi:hypothetical protein
MHIIVQFDSPNVSSECDMSPYMYGVIAYRNGCDMKEMPIHIQHEFDVEAFQCGWLDAQWDDDVCAQYERELNVHQHDDDDVICTEEEEDMGGCYCNGTL